MRVSRYMAPDGDNGGNGTTINVEDNQAVADLARRVGEIEAGRASVEDVNTLRAAVVSSRDQYITRAEYNDLTARLEKAESAASESNRKPAEIKPPEPPPPTQAELEAQAQASDRGVHSGPFKVRMGIFGARQ